jgi:cytochrome b6
VTGATLTRFYALHVSVLPGLVFLLITLHVYLVQRQGMSVPPSVEREGGRPRSIRFVPDFLLRDLVGWLTALAILAAMAAFFPAELGEKADPFAPAPEGIRPEWYFMFMFQTLKYLPARIVGVEGDLVGVLAFGLAAAVLVLVPFLDRASARGERSVLWRNLALAGLLYILVLTWLGYTANPAL